MATDQTEEELAAELIREAALLRLRQEIPHALAVDIQEIEPARHGVVVRAAILVETESQKGIVVGKGGGMIRDIGSAARSALGPPVGHRGPPRPHRPRPQALARRRVDADPPGALGRRRAVAVRCDANGTTTATLIRATLERARRRRDIEVCGIATGRPDVFAHPRAPSRGRHARRVQPFGRRACTGQARLAWSVPPSLSKSGLVIPRSAGRADSDAWAPRRCEDRPDDRTGLSGRGGRAGRARGDADRPRRRHPALPRRRRWTSPPSRGSTSTWTRRRSS